MITKSFQLEHRPLKRLERIIHDVQTSKNLKGTSINPEYIFYYINREGKVGIQW